MNKRANILQSKKVLERRRKKRIAVYSLGTIALISIISAFLFFFRLPFFQISNVVVEGVNILESSELEASALSSIEGSYGGIVPKKNIFFVSKSKIKETLLEDYKQIEDIKVSRKGLRGISVKISERKPHVLVCSGFHEKDSEEEDETCYYADQNGYVFARAPEFSSGVYIRYYIASDLGVLPIGRSFVEYERFEELQSFAESLRGRGIPVLGMLVGEGGMYELYIKNKDLSEAIIYFDDRSPLPRTASNLLAFWDSAQDKKIGTSTIPSFEYINLRFGNNIFYVLK